MNLNIKAEKQNTYDAIVVGSGISGGPRLACGTIEAV